jgi:hypothetical protein
MSASLAFVGVVALAMAFLPGTSAADARSFAAAGLAGLIFVLASFLVVGRKAAIFRIDLLESQSKPEKFKAALKDLGNVPLGSLIVFSSCSSAS